MRKLVLICGCIVLASLLSCSTPQQASGITPVQVSQLLQDQSYQFVATYVQPTGGRQRNLTGNYVLRVTKEEVFADLPYFGKVYTASVGSTDGGIKFTSRDFIYSTETGKKGSREISIKPKDIAETQELFLSVYENGSANLRVNSVNRQSISYIGEIRAIPQRQ
ncbi:DUF4251 domain-containing protein [Flavihumibacter fluvii]|uniref:DUF4251 domain-containing protein n=1 Tax=Flavihumibacter fluvii TaxID=2838157 RepID=UPI001BDE4F15|nr:DUF4251 domain-containing protein [Flavihumibacter fluvii]ULQ51613.1 DUF4251 domain-containing protein [Flavihumibacter fluvii]